jgi:hypothetical protein
MGVLPLRPLYKERARDAPTVRPFREGRIAEQEKIYMEKVPDNLFIIV